jgi:hypothetical protein
LQILLALTIISCSKFQVSEANTSELYAIANYKVFHSSNNGKNWTELNKGLPNKMFPIRLYSSPNKIYLATFSEGLFVLDKGDTTWRSLNSNHFLRRSTMEDRLYRKISAFAVNEQNENHLFAATKHSLYESTDGGLNWKHLRVSGLSSRLYITALHYANNSLYVGTSYGGFFRVTGNSARNLSTNLPSEPYSQTMRFVEQISVIKSKLDSVYLGFYFGAGVFSCNKTQFAWRPFLDKNILGRFDTVDDIGFVGNQLFISSAGSLYYNEDGQIIKDDSYRNILVRSERPDGLLIDTNFDSGIFIQFKKPRITTKSRNMASSSKRAIYTSMHYINRNLDSLIKQINDSELNSIVIDMKDDNGLILFDSKNTTAREINAIRARADISRILKELKDNDIYTIARMVTFKDRALFLGYSNRYAIRDVRNKAPWRGTEGEFWVDPHSEFVQNYNVSLAKEIQDLGFDEIQFDYVRFPSDGAVANCLFPFRKQPDTYRSEVITDFVRLAKKNLTVPVSVDIYGFNSWYHFGNSIGQDMEELSAYVDVICPMVYPSHFGSRFYSKYPHDIRPYRIVLDGGFRAIALADSSVSIRPYLQAFNMMSPTWSPQYILHQINGARESNNDGYTFWNAHVNYKMLFDAFRIRRGE